MCASPAGDFDHDFEGLDAAGPAIVGVLERDQAGPDQVVVHGSNQAGELVGLEHAVGALHGMRHDTTELGKGRLFVVVNMTVGFADEFVTRFAVDSNRNLVGHRPRGHEDGRFRAQHRGNSALEPLHGRVDVDHVVAHLGLRDGLPHCESRFRDGIASQINDGFRHE